MKEDNNKSLKKISKDPEAVKELRDLVLARIQVMPDTVNMAIGSEELSKTDLIQHVKEQDDLGTQIMEMELEFLQDLASGAVYENE